MSTNDTARCSHHYHLAAAIVHVLSNVTQNVKHYGEREEKETPTPTQTTTTTRTRKNRQDKSNECIYMPTRDISRDNN
jgi:hypothetical protein